MANICQCFTFNSQINERIIMLLKKFLGGHSTLVMQKSNALYVTGSDKEAGVVPTKVTINTHNTSLGCQWS